MNRKKWQYFLDYYALKVLAAGFGGAVILCFVVNYIKPRPETMLYAAVYDILLDPGVKQELAEELAEACGEGVSVSQIVIDDSFRSDSRKDVERVQVLAANHALDVIISPDRDMMTSYAGYGYLENLTEVLSADEADYAEDTGRLVAVPGLLLTDEISFEDHESGQGPALPYILSLTPGRLWESLTDDPEQEGFLGVVAEARHQEEAALMARAFLDR